MSFERHQPNERWNRLERIRLDLAALREAFPPLAERKDEASKAHPWNSFQNGRNGQGNVSNEVHELDELSREERLENIQRKLSTASTGRRLVNGQADLYSATLYDSDASASPIGLGQETASAWFEQYNPQAKDTTKATQNLAESWQARLDATRGSRCRQLQQLQQLQQQSSMVQERLQTKGTVEATAAATKRCWRDVAQARVQSALNEAQSPVSIRTSQRSDGSSQDATAAAAKMVQRFELQQDQQVVSSESKATSTAQSSTAREAQSDGSGDGGIFNSEWVTKLLSAAPPSRKNPEVYLHPQVAAVPPPVDTRQCETSTCGSVDWQATLDSGTVPAWSTANTARRSASPARRSASPRRLRPASKYAIQAPCLQMNANCLK
eukprot:s438_g33.t2